eukprot:scaffold2143_cov125-Cylindrotheca_fusiformis.AAC.6
MSYTAPSPSNGHHSSNDSYIKESVNQAAKERRKQRRRLREKEFNKNKTPEDSEDHSVTSENKTPRRRNSKPKYSRSNNTPGSSSNNNNNNNGTGSMIWTILVIGLFFCVVDICYIIYFVDRYPDLVEKAVSHLKPAKQLTPIKTHPPNLTHEYDAIKDLADKAPILNLLQEAGVSLNPETDKELIAELPTWSDVTELYGEKPVIYGLEMCEPFRTHSDPADHFVVRAFLGSISASLPHLLTVSS